MRLAVFIALVLLALQPRSAAAEPKAWTGATGSWTDGGNWSPPGQPQAGDDVTIASGSADLGVDTAVASLTLSGGRLGGSGTLTVNGPVNWTAGTMSGSGTTVAMAGMDLGGTNKTLDGRALVLSGGTAAMNASGSFISMRNGATFTNQAALELSNDGGLTNNQGFFHGGSGGGAFINHGTLRKLTSGNSGITRFAGVPVDNIGTVEVLAGNLSVSGGYAQTAGVTRLNGGTLASETALLINGGTLEGFGAVQASVSSVGEVGPGLSAGALQITGTHAQRTGGTFTVEIGGLTAGTQFDQLNVSGAASLAGALDVRLIDGFAPALGQSFEVMTFASRSGTFPIVTGLDIGGGLALEATYSATNLVLTVVPASVEPTFTATQLATPSVTATFDAPSATPTAMATATSTFDAPSATPTAMATATSTGTLPPSPTATATPYGILCIGDCDGDRAVRIAELVLAVNLALREDSAESCLAIDEDGDDAVAVNELIRAVNSALDGCP